MRVGLFLAYWPWFSLDEQLELTALADELGLDSVWISEAWGQDAVSVLGLLAGRTERVALGSGLMQIPARQPAATAMAAASLDVISGGRFRLGLGVSGPQVSEGWYGVPFAKPLARTREYVQVVRQALSREPLQHAGDAFTLPLDEAHGGGGLGKPLRLLARPVQERIPIYLGAIGPRALEQTGEIADGWLPFLFNPREPEVMLEPVRRGAERAGRGLDDLDVAPVVPVAVDDDAGRARAMGKPWLAFYLGAMGAKTKNFYVDTAARYGFGESARVCQERALAGDRAGAVEAISDELIDAAAICCTPGELPDRLAAYEAAGATSVIAVPTGEDKRPWCAPSPGPQWGAGARLPEPDAERPTGIPGVELPGPYPVGAYAAQLRDHLRTLARVQVFGEVWNLGAGRARVYFELRDERGALPCSMWRNEFQALDLGAEALADGARVVVAGGCDYYPGSAQASPSFSFAATDLRVAGEGDLLAQLHRLRRALAAQGLFEPQKRLRRPALPRAIGVVTGEGGKARDDVLAGLRRRGWAGRLVWAFAPVQDRRAAPAITRALQDLAASGQVDVIVVARGGGSLADLFAFCDETLCRTVALLPVPVVASVGHHADRTLIDDVAAVSCSTPTHAAEAAVPEHCGEARARQRAAAARLEAHGRRAVLDRAHALAALSRAPAEHVARHRSRAHQYARELRAATRRRVAEGRGLAGTHLLVISRSADRAALEHERNAAALRGRAGELRRATAGSLAGRRRDLERLAVALAAHDPERTLARGYALVEGEDGAPVTSAAAARAAGAVSVRFHDDRVRARIESEAEEGCD